MSNTEYDNWQMACYLQWLYGGIVITYYDDELEQQVWENIYCLEDRH